MKSALLTLLLLSGSAQALIIGGVDIWPLKKDSFNSLRLGERDEESISPDNFVSTSQRSNASASYWYVGSISMKPQMNKRDRTELVARLLVSGFESWLARKPKFPAHILALAWTKAGTNILVRNGFERPKKCKSDKVFVRVFMDAEDVTAVLQYWRRYLG